MEDPQEARYLRFYGRMESDDILKLLKNGTVSSPDAALAVLAKRGVYPEKLPREDKKKREDDAEDVDGEDGGLIQMALDFLGNLDFDCD